MLIFYMKKIVFGIFFILFVSAVSGEETYSLKLRTSYHSEFQRVVIEGKEPIISKAIVNQKDRDIIVRFPSTAFIMQSEKESISYKINKDTLLFSPGNFSKFKVFLLKDPSRLVIDMYLEAGKEGAKKSFKPSDETQSRKIKTVVIDPGHGGYEGGIITGDYKEKNAVLDIARMLNMLINKENTICLLTRDSDQFMSLGDRAEFANSKDADIFLSLHLGKHRGIILYAPVITEPVPSYVKTFLINKGQEGYTAKTENLKEAIQKTIVEEFGENMVSANPLPYSILSKIESAALIIELPSFLDAHYDDEFKNKVANAIYKGINLYEEGTAN